MRKRCNPAATARWLSRPRSVPIILAISIGVSRTATSPATTGQVACPARQAACDRSPDQQPPRPRQPVPRLLIHSQPIPACSCGRHLMSGSNSNRRGGAAPVEPMPIDAVLSDSYDDLLTSGVVVELYAAEAEALGAF